MTSVDLFNTLEDLGDKEFKNFNWFLQQPNILEGYQPVKKSKLENAERRDTVDLMVNTFKLHGALKVTKKILKKINRNDLVQSLSDASSGPEALENKESPADWRSKLKPISQPAGPSQSSPKPWANGAGKSQTSELSVGPSPSSRLPSPSISVTPPAAKGSLNDQRDPTANGTKSKSKKMKPGYMLKEDIIRELQEIEDNFNELEKRKVELEVKLRSSEEGFLNDQRDPTANGTKSESKKMKPDYYILKDDIIRELQEIEVNLNEWEKRAVELEVKLRSSEEEGEDDSLIVEWFSLIRNKQVALRRESELVYVGKTQDLEEEQPTVEQELRRLMEKPDRLKTTWDRKREEQLMAKLVEIVNDRNAIIEGLTEDRLREDEEDEELNKMMMNFNVKQDRPTKKSPMSKLFGWENKKEG